MTTNAPTSPRAFHARLLREHAELEAGLQRLIEAFETGDQETARTAFREFDRQLAAHVQLEDDLLLPEFAAFDPLEAEQIAAEHRAIRTVIDELVIGSDLHLARVSAIRELAEVLRAHAQREDASLYRWVDRVYGDESVSSTTEEPAPSAAPSP